MKYSTLIVAFLAIVAPINAADKQPAQVIRNFKSYRGCSEKASEVIRKLGDIFADDLKISKQPLMEALSALQTSCMKGHDGGVINFVIRRPRQEIKDVKNLDLPIDLDPPIALSLESKKISFAAALDELCTQAKFEWNIEFSEDNGTPLLIIKPKQGEQVMDANRPKTPQSPGNATR